MKYLSRKFIVAIGSALSAIGVPVLFKHMEINDTITFAVLGVVVAVGVAYGHLNVIEKKLDGSK